MTKIDLGGLLREANASCGRGEYYQVRALVAIAAELREMNERGDMRMAMALDAEQRDYRQTIADANPRQG